MRPRASRGAARPGAALVALVGLVALAALTPAPALGRAPLLTVARGLNGEPARVEDEILVDPVQQTRLDVYLDRVGVMMQPRADSLAAVKVASFLGSGAPTDRYADGFTVFPLRPDSLSRRDILARARRLARLRPELVARAGLVVSLRGTYSPMIVPDEIVVQLKQSALHAPIDSLLATVSAVATDSNFYRPGQFLASRSEPGMADTSLGGSPGGPAGFIDAFEAADRIRRSTAVRYAVPNFIHAIEAMGGPAAEPLYSRQWHLENTGQAGGSPDADVDASSAWTITTGRSDVIVAIHDAEFDLTHLDLVDQLWTNPSEVCSSSDFKDDDHNRYYDDIHGWDFQACYVGCGSPPYQEHCYACGFTPRTDKDCETNLDRDKRRCGKLEVVCVSDVNQLQIHGTCVAGIVAASGTNGYGVTGIAPGVKLMLLRRAIDEYSISKAFDYAREQGASIINNSWKLTTYQVFTSSLRDAIADAAEDGRGGLGCIVVFSMSDEDRNDCTKLNANDSIFDITRSDGRDAVFAVSGSDNLDRKASETGYGDCMELLAPTQGGTLNITTADFSGDIGYNASTGSKGYLSPCPTLVAGDPEEGTDPGITYCFRGTSAAAPMVSGVAALVLSANPKLSQPEVHRLLQDTADKVENDGATAARYDAVTGFSSGSGAGSTHGWGRVNAYEAVRVAANTGTGATGSVDLFVRDNDLDWGNTERPSSTALGSTSSTLSITSSTAIRVDATPGTATAAPAAASEFALAPDETMLRGSTNRISILLRNRGAATSGAPTVKLLWAPYATAPPALPSDFWSRFPADPGTLGDWIVVGTASVDGVPYSGASSTRGGETDASKVVSFDFTPPSDPTGAKPHSLFFVVVDAEGDRPAAKSRKDSGTSIDSDLDVDSLVGTDNNITQKRFE